MDLVLNEVAEAIKANEEDLQIYTSGATNIFKYPELSDGIRPASFRNPGAEGAFKKSAFRYASGAGKHGDSGLHRETRRQSSP